MIPQWQSINEAKWRQIENHLRKYAKNIQITTGGFGQLSATDKSGTSKNIQLDNDGIVAPLWIYKQIHSTNPNLPKFIVTLNDYHAKTVPSLPNCTRVDCPENFKAIEGPKEPIDKDFRRGYTFCAQSCLYDEDYITD